MIINVLGCTDALDDDNFSASGLDEISINVIPPTLDILTDEEDIDEDNLTTNKLPADTPGYVEIECGSDSDDELLSLTLDNGPDVELQQHGGINGTACTNQDLRRQLTMTTEMTDYLNLNLNR
ncbi:hypothetical protein FQR65_LT11945 [Abscondita terminalis]|nr:hypothetical protein FQR65_LT11945 [Abscondita terminalis]